MMTYLPNQLQEMMKYQTLQQQAFMGAVQRTIEAQLSIVEMQMSLVTSFNRTIQQTVSQFNDTMSGDARSASDAEPEEAQPEQEDDRAPVTQIHDQNG